MKLDLSVTQQRIKHYCVERAKDLVKRHRSSAERDQLIAKYAKVHLRAIQHNKGATRAIVNQIDDEHLDKLVAGWMLEH